MYIIRQLKLISKIQWYLDIRVPQHTSFSRYEPMSKWFFAFSYERNSRYEFEPLLVYHSENPRAFKSHKILKEKLQVMWRSNPKAWVTRKFFVEWVNLVFGPTVKKYPQENNLPVQALLILDNAPAHPQNLEDDILEELKFIKFLYLPPNTTPIYYSKPRNKNNWGDILEVGTD